MPGYSVLHGMARAAKSLVFALWPEVGSAVLEDTLAVLVTPGHSASNKKGLEGAGTNWSKKID
jgi:hypothetical protein